MIQKLALGTVQFGLDYGISNTGGKTPCEEVCRILQQALKHGITIIDTARAYGDAEDVLSRCNVELFQLVSKFPAGTTSKNIAAHLQASLLALKQSKVYAYIAHSADDLLQDADLWGRLQELKANGLVEKTGYSLYTTDQLERLFELNIIPDLVQIPYNILDRKFEPWFSRFEQLGIEVHIRSVFLQGLFFMDVLPEKLKPMETTLSGLKNIAEKHNMRLGQLALNFVIHTPAVTAVVVGVNTSEQLEQNVADILPCLNSDIIADINSIQITDTSLLNPVNWK